ncbi:hypothetical protein CgunFtcFv8_006254 [Champsocephalus gunnari]|uniref:Uncharacterized protein n=1 Tax=Champsocephalus gunnari TaxID=52237 RepID=A0AAN8GWC9_CHAGU|nr:hypothetical protein CgunFtcFv8_006254 [Champsocephalus gunnari]
MGTTFSARPPQWELVRSLLTTKRPGRTLGQCVCVWWPPRRTQLHDTQRDFTVGRVALLEMLGLLLTAVEGNFNSQ